eukprot:m.342741 g.342741  ORF g.342741 m.342741 type:complete len:715 (-) comp21771_c0_seq1:149-2293(-)
MPWYKPPSKVFVANVDAYVPKKLAELLSQSIVGKSTTEDEDEEEEDDETLLNPKPMYTIVGTLSSKDAVKPDCVAEIVEGEVGSEELKAALLDVDLIVWDIMVPSASELCTWAAEMLQEATTTFKRPKVLVCISSVLTLAKTKPVDPEDTDTPIAEEEYKRRRPHLRYRPQMDCEKLVLKCGRKNNGRLTTYVVAAGILYGMGEETFHSLFKAAWHLDPRELPCLGNGDNTLPTIHIKDLCGAVLNVLEARPEEAKFILAVDEGQYTLKEITSCLANKMGSGQIQHIDDSAESDAGGLFTRYERDQLSVSLKLEAPSIKELNIPWVAQAGFIESIDTVIAEYKQAHNLMPIKICMLGPPASGKTTYAKILCKEYKLHYVQKDEVISEAVTALELSAAQADDEELDDETKAKANEDKEMLETLKTQLEENNGSYEDTQITTWMLAKIKSMPCLNQGYILDGYPETAEQAEALFVADEDAEDSEAPNPLTMPDHVIVLDAGKDYIFKRCMNLPGAVLKSNPQWDEKQVTARHQDYLKKNKDDAVAFYFDVREVHPHVLDMEGLEINLSIHKSGQLSKAQRLELQEGQVMKQMRAIFGTPHNYGPTPEEEAEIKGELDEHRAKLSAIAQAEKEERDKEEGARLGKAQAAWEEKRTIVMREAAQAMEATEAPLRNFLMQHVMPTLTEGLVEVDKIRPEDPVDFLAEYLFRNNPIPNLK